MRPAAALAAAAWLAAAAAPAGATITPTRDPTTATNAAVAAGFPLSTQGQFFLAIPPNGNPVATADAASGLAGFPRDGSTFLILSTGDATRADQPDQAGTFPSVNDGQDQPIRQGGASAFDISELQVNFASIGNVSSGCLGVDFRFLSEEYPSKLGAQFNDAFIAEGDNTTGWTTDATSVSAPENFASQPFGQPLTIDSGAPIVMSPAEAAGTPYGAATGVMHAQIQVPAAGSHRLQLTLLDHGDAIVDSAVFVDNVTFAAGATCTRGVTSLGPAVAITGPTVAATVDTPTPTLTGTANGPGAVTARIYSGAMAAGAPVQTLPAARLGNAWSAVAGALAPGQYTVQATQGSATPGVNGVSAPRTFTVVPGPGGAGAGGGGSSSQQSSGDRDNDGIPDDQDTSDGSLPPVPGKTFDARVVSGDVFIKYPPGTGPRAAVTPPKGFVALKGAANVPMGAQLDTRRGRVAVTSAHDTSGSAAQTADFYDGIFAVKQATPKTKPAKPKLLITDLVLKGEPPRSECAPIKGASAAAAKKKKRGAKSVLGGLWGSGKGKFRTDGKYSSATVRGTIWLTQDRCDGTLTKVKRGTVSVRDFKRRKTVSVKAGHSYLARAARAASKAKGAK